MLVLGKAVLITCAQWLKDGISTLRWCADLLPHYKACLFSLSPLDVTVKLLQVVWQPIKQVDM